MKPQAPQAIAARVAPVDRLARTLLIGAVHAYRRWLSGRKSTRCAHGITHGTTCSAAALRALREQPVGQALHSIRSQFRACAASHAALSSLPPAPISSVSDPAQLVEAYAADNACCEAVVEVGIRKSLTLLLGVWFALKYLMAFAYHSGSFGAVGSWVFEWLGPSLIGAAGSELWPIVLASLGCDIAVLVAIQSRTVPDIALAGQLFLSLFVLFLENLLLMALGSIWQGLGSFLVFETLDIAMTRISASLGVIWLPKKMIIAIAWVAATYVVWIGTTIAKDDV